MFGRRSNVACGGVVFGLLAFGATGLTTAQPAQAADEWKLTSYVPVGSATWKTMMGPYIDTVHAITDSEIKIKGYSVGVLAGPFDSWKAIRRNVADVCVCFSSFITNIDPVNAIFGGLAGGLDSLAYVHWMHQGGGEKLWQQFRRETQGLQNWAFGGMGPSEIFMHSHKKVEKIEDLKGMKIRTTGAWASILKDLGASPTVLAPGDIYTSLERKVIDATEWITPMSNIRMGLHKIAKYIVIPGIHQPAFAQEIVMRAKDHDKLSRTDQVRLAMAARLSGFDTDIYQGIEDLKAMEKLRAGRNTWVILDPSMRDKVTEMARKWTAEQAKKQAAKGNMWTQKVQDSYWAFFDQWKKHSIYRVK